VKTRKEKIKENKYSKEQNLSGPFCGLVVRVLATDPEVIGSIPGAIKLSEK
jgi:hypothetical protein